MAIKKGIPPLKSIKLDDQFPSAVRRPFTFPFHDEDEVEKLEKALARARRRQLINAEAARMVYELRPEELDVGEKDAQEAKVETKREPKRYNVNMETGVITVDEENGEHTYKDALLVSSSIRAQRGEYDKAISLIAALREFTKVPEGEGQRTKKGFYVKDDGTIVADPENGELTLSEARAISESKRALITSKEGVTPEKLDLLKKDITETLENAIAELRHRLTAQEQEALFTIGNDGKPAINPKARLGINEFLLFQMMENLGKKSDTFIFKDGEGNVLPLPDWLEINRFKREEARKDDRHNAIVDLIREGRQQLPKLIDGLKNLASSRETDEAMLAGGWKGDSKVKSAPCAACHEPISYTELPAVMPCPKCKTLNVLGDPVQQKEILGQLANQLVPEKKEEGKKEDEAKEAEAGKEASA